jgi:hypothetical protein
MQISTFVAGVSPFFEVVLFESHGLCPVSDQYQSDVRLTTQFTTSWTHRVPDAHLGLRDK